MATRANTRLTRYRFTQMHMGVAVRLTLFAESGPKAEQAATAAFARFRELDNMMSDYQTSSELNELCRRAGEGPVVVSPELFLVLATAERIRIGSQGVFDVRTGPLTRLWREARQRCALPEEKAIDAARTRALRSGIELDPAIGAVTLKPGTLIDLGGIAKGFACDEAMKALAGAGVCCGLIEAGGDLVALGTPPETPGWPVKAGSQIALLKDQACSTTGSTEQFFEKGGIRYSHCMDPCTGWPREIGRCSSIIAGEGLWADPLSQIEAVSPGRGVRLLKHAQAIEHS